MGVTAVFGIGRSMPGMVLIKPSHSPGDERSNGTNEEKAPVRVLVPVLPRLCQVTGSIHPLGAAHE